MIRRLLALRWRLLPLLAAVIILCLPFAEHAWNNHRIIKDSQAAQQRLAKTSVAKFQGVPSRILIPSLKIDLPIVPQSYSQDIRSWPVTSDTANYASETPPANNTQGQSMVYGHDTSGVFGPLLNMQPNSIAYIFTDNGHLFQYSYASSKDVTPDKVDIVTEMSKGEPGLNLITCSGDNFQYRRVMSFKLLKAA